MWTVKTRQTRFESMTEVLAARPPSAPVRFVETLPDTIMTAEALKERRLAAVKISELTNRAVAALNHLAEKMTERDKP